MFDPIVILCHAMESLPSCPKEHEVDAMYMLFDAMQHLNGRVRVNHAERTRRLWSYINLINGRKL